MYGGPWVTIKKNIDGKWYYERLKYDYRKRTINKIKYK